MSKTTTDKEGQESAAGSANSEAKGTSLPPIPGPEELLGACFYVDAGGQNRCVVTTAQMCDKIPNSEFHPGKNCPDF